MKKVKIIVLTLILSSVLFSHVKAQTSKTPSDYAVCNNSSAPETLCGSDVNDPQNIVYLCSHEWAGDDICQLKTQVSSSATADTGTTKTPSTPPATNQPGGSTGTTTGGTNTNSGSGGGSNAGSGTTSTSTGGPNTANQSNGSECKFDSNSEQLCNPIAANDLKSLFVQVIKYILGIISLLAVVMIVISGLRMVISGGNETQLKGAKATLKWSVIGLVVALGAYSIVAIIQSVIKGS